MTQLFLPFPPSVNCLFSNRKGGRMKTARYKFWQAEAAEALLKQLKHRREHSGQVGISLFLSPPNKMIRDLDNTLKAVCDFLVNHKIIQSDDSRILRKISAEWKDDMPTGCYVTVLDILPPMQAEESLIDRFTAKGRGK